MASTQFAKKAPRASSPLVLAARPNDWASIVKAQQEAVRLGQYQRIGVLLALCFEYTECSNPRMLDLAQQRNAQGRPAWPGINLDWLNGGPEIAIAAGVMLMGGGPELVIPSRPFPLPPDTADPTWMYSEATPAPKTIPQRIEDRAMRIKGTNFLIVQPVIQIHWRLDLAAPGHARKEVHNVSADGNGLHMAFIYDRDAQTGHLVNGRVL